jgi:serine/threonine protein kinase
MALIRIQDKSLRVGDTFTIGRAKTCNLAIGHPSLSREHARVFRDGDDYKVEDLHSANGTTLNGRPLIGGAQPLADGDVLLVGEVEMRFLLGDGAGAEAEPAPAAVAMTPARRLAKILGTELGGYKVLSLIRQEVAGPLLRATHGKTGREVQLWVLDPLIEDNELPEFFQHFVDLLTSAAGLKHPELIRVYQCGKDDGLIWYATEAPTGSTLAQLVHRGFTPLQAVQAVLGLCRLLHVYHEAGLVHGDITPAQIHLDDAGKVRLGSFGLAGLNSTNRKRLQAAGSTRQVYYLDPDQARSGDCNVRSDGYSVGCVLVHLLTGRPPFIGANFQEVLEAHASQPVPAVAQQLGLPPLLDEILAGFLAKNSFHRYNDLGPAITDLDTLRAMIEP